MNATTKNTSKEMSNTTANLIACGIMAVVIIVGILYGMQLDAIGY